jgi:hypothetical protein
MLTVNVCPAPAVTPHMACFLTSPFVFLTLNWPHTAADVGATVG